MLRSILSAAVLLSLFALTGDSRQVAPKFAPNVVPTDPLPPEKEKAHFRLPPGFEAQLVASEPDIQKPMNLAFDEQGRLWVTDTIEYPYPAKGGTTPRDTVKVLSDFAPDGRARSITTFASGLNIPIGVLPLPGVRPIDALVYSIPNIWRLRDSTGKGVADRRDVFVGTYETRDTHGMTNAFLHSFDGWIYACHGFSNRSTIQGSDRQAITLQSGNTYRMRPDGSHLEQYTWGQVNPFGLGTDRWGYFYTSDCHSEPIYQLIREGHYPSFGKPHDGLGFAPQMFTAYKGSTAVAGLVCYEADGYPREYRGTFFVGDVMTNQVVQFKATWNGASPVATQHVLLESTDHWFRPVDVKLGPDGALYVADFYNRIIGHYEVPLEHPGRDRHRGRIWRIVYKGPEAKATPAPGNLATATDQALVAALGHPNQTVRLQATQQLAHRGAGVVAIVRPAADDANPDKRVHALWVLDRLKALDEPGLARAARDGDPVVRNHAQRILSERGKWSDAERDLALAGLTDASPHVRRASAEAVGRHPDARNVRAVLDLCHATPPADTHLRHTARIALRNQLRPAGNWKAVSPAAWTDQDARTVADICLGIASPEAAHYLVSHLEHTTYPTERTAEFVHHIARHGSKHDVQTLVASARRRAKSPSMQVAILRAIDRGVQERGQGLPAEAREWATHLCGQLLEGKSENQIRQGAELVGQLRVDKEEPRLVSLATNARSSGAVRLAALSALASLDATRHAGTMGKLLRDERLPVEVREQVANLLARANQSTTRNELLTTLPLAPARMQNSIAATLAQSRDGAEALLKLIGEGKASARLLQEQSVLTRLKAARLPNLKERLERLTVGLPPADARLTALLRSRRKGFETAKADPAKGAAVFEKNCANCHQIGGKGAKVGPQLDGIGLRGLDRLLEDTLDPNRNVDQAFRTTSLTLLSGNVIQGLVLREEGAILVLADQQGKEVRVAKKDIEQRQVSPLSPMPANLVDTIPEADFHHLLGYLLTQRPGG